MKSASGREGRQRGPDVPTSFRWSRWILAFRLARREVRRHPWRHALVVLMITVPVLSAMVAFSAVSTWQHIDHTQSTSRAYNSDLVVHGWDDRDDAVVATFPSLLPPGSSMDTVWTASDWFGTATELSDGSEVQMIGARTTQIPDVAEAAGRVLVDHGRLPIDAGEIFLTRELARLGSWQIGDEVVSGRDDRRFIVSGIGAVRDDVTVELAVLGDVPDSYWATDLPGYDQVTMGVPTAEELTNGYWDTGQLTAGRETYVWLPDGTDVHAVEAELRPSPVGVDLVETSEVDALVGPGMALVFGALSAIVAIVSSAAFAIASRRQLRSVGLLATAGADPATIRAALVLQGALPGLVAAALALVLGLVGARVIDSRGILESVTDVGGVSPVISVGGVALAVVLGVLAGTMSAWLPARSASRVPVLSALAGRRPVGPVPTRVPLTGLVFVAAGGAGLAVLVRQVTSDSDSSGPISTVTPVLMIVTVLAMLFGLITLAPTLVATVGALSTRITGTTRIALRGIARHRTQSAAAVAAVAICLAVPVGVLTTKSSLDADDNRSSVDHRYVGMPSSGAEFATPVPPAARSVRADERSMALSVQGDFTSDDLEPLVADVEAVTGPVTRVPFITFSDGAGGWYPVAAIEPEAAASLLTPWAAEQLLAGRAVALQGAAGQVTLDDDITSISLDAVGAPDGDHAMLAPGPVADYLVPAGVLQQVAVGRPPLAMLLLRTAPLTSEEVRRLESIRGESDSGPRAPVKPTLAELRAASRSNDVTPADELSPGDRDVWIHIDYDAVEYGGTEHGGMVSAGSDDLHPDDLQAAPEPLLPEDQGELNYRRWLRAVALAAGALSLLVLTITLSLRAVDSVDDHHAAIAAGAAPSRIRRQHAVEGMVLASLGALLALPLGWLPVTAVRFGQVRRRSDADPTSSFDAITSRLHTPGWEVVPILLVPIAAVGVVWIVAPWLRSLMRRGPVDQVLPRY